MLYYLEENEITYTCIFLANMKNSRMVTTKGVYRDFSKDLFIGFFVIQYWRIGLEGENVSILHMDMD